MARVTFLVGGQRGYIKGRGVTCDSKPNVPPISARVPWRLHLLLSFPLIPQISRFAYTWIVEP